MGINRPARACPLFRTPGVRALFLLVTVIMLASTIAGEGPSRQSQAGPSHFVRIFQLPPFAPPTPEVTAALIELGKRGGLMDAHDDLDAGPFALIVDPFLSRNNRDNDQHTAGTTFLGQFSRSR